MKYFLRLIILFFCLMWANNTFATNNLSADEAEKWAQTKGQQLLTILTSQDVESKFAQLDKILYEDVDLDYAGKFVVGKYWKKMTPEQQAKYIPLFKRYMSGIYKSFPLDLEKGQIEYAINKAVINKNSVDVFCTVKIAVLTSHAQNQKNNGNGIPVIFSLVKNDNKIQVRDFKVAESSILLALRNRFTQMIVEQDEEIDWFLEDFETIINDNEEKNQQKLDMQ